MSDSPLDALSEVIAQAVPILLEGLEGLDIAQRHLHPPRFEGLAKSLEPLEKELTDTMDLLNEALWPEDLGVFREPLAGAVSYVLQGLRLGVSAHSDQHWMQWIKATRSRIRATEMLYPLCSVFSPINRYFIETPYRDQNPLAQRARDAMHRTPSAFRMGVMHAQNDRKSRGGFSLYVPEYYDDTRSWPLVVILHGGSGHGADFLWAWLREARTRGFIVLAPTARGGTWSLMDQDIDGPPIQKMIDYVSEHWRVDPDHVLLTGMSDGATYSLLVGLQDGMPFTDYAPISGVLHPLNAINGNMDRAKGRRIYLVHGALDWGRLIGCFQ